MVDFGACGGGVGRGDEKKLFKDMNDDFVGGGGGGGISTYFSDVEGSMAIV